MFIVSHLIRLEITIKLLECKQCGRVHWAHRSSKKWCKESCKQKNKRGEAPHDYYAETGNAAMFRRLDFMTDLHMNNPHVFNRVHDIKELFGYKAMNEAIDLLILFAATQGD